MPKRGRGPKPNRGQGNTDKYETISHIGPSFVGRNSKQTHTHHARTVYLDSGNNSPCVTQPTKGRKGPIGTHSQCSQPIKRGSLGGTKMTEHEDHVERTCKNQVNEEQSTFGFPIVDLDVTVQMKNIPPSTLPHFYGKVNEYPDSFLFEFDILGRSYDYSFDAHKLKFFSRNS